MMDLTAYGVVGYIILIIAVVCIRILAVFIVAGAIATHFGLTGILWWASSIVMFLLINAVISKLTSN